MGVIVIVCASVCGVCVLDVHHSTHTYTETHRHTGTQIYRRIDTQTHRHIDTRTYR